MRTHKVRRMYPNWVHPFLVNLERTGNISKSARLAGVTSGAAYQKRKSDGDFAAAWDQAIEDHTDRCEEELTRRAFGYEEPVVYQGQLTPLWKRDDTGKVVIDDEGNPVQERDGVTGKLRWLTVTKFSDVLLLARVKAYRKRYSTDRTELVTTKDIATMSEAEIDAELAAVTAQLAKLPKTPKDENDDPEVYA